MAPFADPDRSDIASTCADATAVAPDAAEVAPASPCVGPFGLDASGFDADTALLYNFARCYDLSSSPKRWPPAILKWVQEIALAAG
jgi:hypothetical protein